MKRKCQCDVLLDDNLDAVDFGHGACTSNATFVIQEGDQQPDRCAYVCDNHLKIVCQGIHSSRVWWSSQGFEASK